MAFLILLLMSVWVYCWWFYVTISDDLSDSISDDLSDYISDDLSDYIADGLSVSISEDLSDFIADGFYETTAHWT